METELRFEQVVDDVTLADWRHTHNVIIPVDELTVDEVRERLGRHRLEVVYLRDDLIGCTTVRPPATDGAAAIVIVRVLAEHRRRGFGAEIYQRALGQARELGVDEVETIVWAPNVAGLEFARARGFVEVASYLPPGGEAPFVTLRLT